MAQIKTFARLKPSKRPFPGYGINKNVLTIHMPDSKDFLLDSDYQNFHSNVSYDITFTNIFDPSATQEQVFDGVANDIIQNFLKGYNGTIFAYGQTGTGKTYTVEGNACKYKSRGLATRALSMIYEQLEQRRKDEHITVYLSYLEIYQEVAYDLLSVNAVETNMSLAPFAKVKVVEGPNGSCILPNLSLHIGGDEEVAQMLLFQGQANRKVAETPVNMRSSRSHAVFTVYLQAKKFDSDVMISSKLHLVDLAGSERVSKTGVDGQQLTEAKSINLSLHHLETVIIALQVDRSERGNSAGKASRGEVSTGTSRSNSATFMSGQSSDNPRVGSVKYVPYRNSLLTMVLKDSLGGNCLTAMIATISLEAENLGESISTCRFAQRVACVANSARRNEELDDKTLIKRLKGKVAHLEKQVAALRSKGQMNAIMDTPDISNEDREMCAQIMDGYLQGLVPDPVAAGICDQCRFRECLHVLRERYLSSDPGATRLLAIDGGPSAAGFSVQNPHHDGGDHAVIQPSPGPDEHHNEGKPGPATRGGWMSTPSSTPAPSKPVNDSVPGSAKSSERKHKGKDKYSSMEQKVDEMSQLLQQISSKDKFRSPYERQREKEIKRLSRKLNVLDQSQQEDTQKIEEMKKNTAMEELQTAETNLRLKLKVAEDQVADQHAYLLQLRHIQADPDLIERETLVEKHLVKRQTKFQEKLKEVIDSHERLEQATAVGAGAEGEEGRRPKLDDKVGQYRQGKGSLNTRQVFQMLKGEEKKMKKEEKVIEREKVVQKTKHLAMKEEATLVKLRDLKQMLKQSQHSMDSHSLSVEGSNNHVNNHAHEQLSHSQMEDRINMHNHSAAGSHNEVKVYMTQEMLSTNGSTHDKTVSTFSDPYLNTSSPLVELMAKKMSEMDKINNTNNFLSSQPSPVGIYSEQGGDNTPYMRSGMSSAQPTSWPLYPSQDGKSKGAVSIHNVHASHKFSDVVGEDCIPAATPGVTSDYDFNNNDNKNNSQAHRSSNTNQNNFNSSNQNGKMNRYGSFNGEMSLPHDEDLKVSDLVSDHDVPFSNGVNGSGGHHSSNQQVSHSPYKKTEEEVRFTSSSQLLKPTSIMSPQRFSSSSSTSKTAHSGSTILPSEYVNSMSNEDTFDARKMGLSSRNFDSALSHMLDSNLVSQVAANSTPDSAEYDKFARTSGTSQGTHNSPYIQRTGGRSQQQHSRSPTRKRSQSPTKVHSSSSHRSSSKILLDAQSVWGPDSKDTSVADRIMNFLDTNVGNHGTHYRAAEKPLDAQPPKPKPRKPRSSDRERNAFIQKVSKYDDQDDDEYSENEDSFFGTNPEKSFSKLKLKALKEEEREIKIVSRATAERERIAKIRKAQDAAQTIQKSWKRYIAKKRKCKKR